MRKYGVWLPNCAQPPKRAKEPLFPIPCSLFPIPYSLFPVPYSLFSVPSLFHLTKAFSNRIISPYIQGGVAKN